MVPVTGQPSEGATEQAAVEAARYSDESEELYRQRYRAVYESDPAGQTQGFGERGPYEAASGVSDFEPFPQVLPGQRTIADEALDRAAEYAAQRNSLAFIVWRQGRIEREVYFEGGTPETLFESGSLAKPMAVLAVGRAMATGDIESLDQPVADYLHEWRGTPKEPMVLRHLLGMRSGLLPQQWSPAIDSVMARANLHPHHGEIIINEYPLVHPPGSRYDYANVNAELVAPVIERATGSRYGRWVSEQLLEPLGARGGRFRIDRTGGLVHAGGGARFPADTYLRMAILVLRNGVWDGERLLPPDFVQAMKEPSPENPHAGLGLYIGSPYRERRGPLNPEFELGTIYHSEPYAADDLVLFDGNANQVAYIVPSEDLVIMRLGRWPDRDRGWDNAALPNMVIRGIREPGRADLPPAHGEQ